jgi:hypothetical protein
MTGLFQGVLPEREVGKLFFVKTELRDYIYRALL